MTSTLALDTISTEPQPLDLAASLDAMHLANSLDRADLAAIVAQTERRVAARLGSSLTADAAQADALNRAIRAVARDGQPLALAINQAIRDAIRDATERAARDSLASLDATDADGRSLADRLDTGTAAARLSNYDTQQGVWRGVARVPHPTDSLRPEMPSPEHLAEMARDHIDPNRRALLDACLAVNVAAQEQHRDTIAAMTAYVAQANADAAAATLASRRALAAHATAERRTTEAARRMLKKRPPVPGPRPVDTLRAIAHADDTYTPPGRAVAAATRDLAETAATYWTHRDALAAVVLADHAEKLDAEAARQRRNATAAAVIASGWTRGQETPAQRLQRVARARLALRRTRRAAWQQSCAVLAHAHIRTHSRISHAAALAARPQHHGRYTADNGQAQVTGHRPMVRLPLWTESYGLRRRLSLAHSTEQASDHHKRADTIAPALPAIPRHGLAAAALPWHACDAVRLPEQPADSHDGRTIEPTRGMADAADALRAALARTFEQARDDAADADAPAAPAVAWPTTLADYAARARA